MVIYISFLKIITLNKKKKISIIARAKVCDEPSILIWTSYMYQTR